MFLAKLAPFILIYLGRELGGALTLPWARYEDDLGAASQVCPLQLKEPSTKHNTTHTVWAPWVYCFLLPSYFLFFLFILLLCCPFLCPLSFNHHLQLSLSSSFFLSVSFCVLRSFLFSLPFSVHSVFWPFPFVLSVPFPSFLHSICWRKHEHIRFGGHYKLHYPWYSGHFQTYQILQSIIFTQTPYGSQRYSRYWKFPRIQCWKALDPKRWFFIPALGKKDITCH